MSDWAREETRTADLGDRRLNKRLGIVLGQLGEHPQPSIPAAGGGWAETLGAYRLFDNEKATFEQVLAPHRDATVERMKACQVVLLAQDTAPRTTRACASARAGWGRSRKWQSARAGCTRPSPSPRSGSAWAW